jgi:hypothetical protein
MVEDEDQTEPMESPDELADLLEEVEFPVGKDELLVELTTAGASSDLTDLLSSELDDATQYENADQVKEVIALIGEDEE